ncbi:MAG: cell division protein ZipA [Aquisalimonadaceae bacterium]
MDTLRWILLILGVLVVAGLYGYYRWQEDGFGGAGKRRQRHRGDHDVDAALRDLEDLVIGDPEDADPVDSDLEIAPRETRAVADWDDPEETVSAPRVRPSAGQARASASATTAEPPDAEDMLVSDSLESDPAWQDAGEKIVVLHVTAGKGYLFTGPALLDSLERIGLRHGMHGIYHWMLSAHSGSTPMFSVANMVEPGQFDPDQAEDMETPGVAMFMQLPGPFDGLTAFERMLETARRLADELDGQILDAQRCDLNAQAIEHIREDLREYRRKAHLAARKSRA